MNFYRMVYNIGHKAFDFSESSYTSINEIKMIGETDMWLKNLIDLTQH